MDKRAPLRQHFQAEASQVTQQKQYEERTAQLRALEYSIVNAFNSLVRFMDGKTTKTEVVNQLKSISTPDVDKVVKAVSKLDADVLANKLDLKPVVDALNGMKRELGLIPKSLPKIPEARDSVKVTNLSEVKLDTTALEKAVKGLKLDPTIDVKAPIINVDAPDLQALQGPLLDLLKAIKNQQYPEIPVTDLKTLESQGKDTNKKLDEANKNLKKLIEKPVGGGGGGGSGVSYQTSTGTSVRVTVEDDGSVPVTIKADQSAGSTVYSKPTDAYALSDIDDSTTTEYYGYEKSDGGWYIKKLASNAITFVKGSSNYSTAWTNRASQTYASFATTF